MRFEYDKAKSNSNKDKHGIDFDEAQELWKDNNLFEVQLAYEDEQRSIVIGIINGKYWTAVVTYRGSAIRIISVRRSRKKEVRLYDQDNQS